MSPAIKEESHDRASAIKQDVYTMPSLGQKVTPLIERRYQASDAEANQG